MVILSDTCINFIKSWEKFVAKPYHGTEDPPNVNTIGYGTTVYPPFYMKGAAVKLSDPGIAEQQASDFLKWRVGYSCKFIDPFLRDDLNENQFAALISLAYNIGEPQFKTSTVLRLVNQASMDGAIRDAFMMWVHVEGGIVSPGLVARRKAEADLYFTP